MATSENPLHTAFQWIPGQGPDGEALARLKSQFARPTRAMGEAWFMGEERIVYDWLLKKDVGELRVEEIQTALAEIASGLTVFGHMDAWADWFGYLLPRCIPRAFDYFTDYLIEHLVTAFMAVMPDPTISWGYPTFREDALLTLGRAIMAPALWPDGPHQSSCCLHRGATTPTGYPIWGDASGDFSASMFFRLKYLEPSEVPGWTKSVFAVPCPRWRAQLLVWLCGAKDIVDGKSVHPADLDEQGPTKVDWAWSHLIRADNAAFNESVENVGQSVEFLPTTNRGLFTEIVAEILTEKLLAEWLESLMEFEHLFDQVTGTAAPERLRQLYGF